MLDTKILQKKNVLVTGSTSGIGAAVAQAFASRGCNLVITGLGELAENQAYAKKLAKDYHIKTTYIEADLSKVEECEKLAKTAISAFETIDILVNNAGMQYVSGVTDFPIDKWNLVLSLNLSASFYLIKHILPSMRAGGYGRIINIASAHGLVASMDKSAYVASKHGLVGLTKVIALETAKENITCNAICPGWVLTPLVQKQIDAIAKREDISLEEASIKLLSEKQPSEQFVKPEDIGALAVFLSSDSAAQITGTTQSIDGGWTAR